MITPLSTKDDDHPALKTAKNVIENIGFDLVADTAFEVIGGAVKGGAKNKARSENVKAQSKEVAKSRKDVQGFDPYRDKAIASNTQGNINSSAPGPEITRQLDKIDRTPGADYGSG